MAREKKSAAPDPASLSFEEAMERLQTIVDELEGGQLSLEESLAHYEEGVKLSKRLTQTLDESEKRIERLAEGALGETVTEPMDLAGEEGAPGGPGGAGRGPGKPAARPDREGGRGGPTEELPF